MQESGAKRPAKLPQRESDEENDRADSKSDACQEGEADGDVPAHQSKMTKSAEAPEATQEAPLGYSALNLPRGGACSVAGRPRWACDRRSRRVEPTRAKIRVRIGQRLVLRRGGRAVGTAC